jgi:hypothetical protein
MDGMNFYTVLAILLSQVTVPAGGEVGFEPLSGYGEMIFYKILQDKDLPASGTSE